jgi:hypothetical protein
MNQPQNQTPPAPVAPTQAEAQALQVMSRSELVSGAFENSNSFSHAQRIAKMLCRSQLVPEQFRGDENLPNTVMALDIALRLKLNPMLVMQQMYVVYGKPGWSAQFIVGVLNASKRFETIRFESRDLGNNQVGNVKFHDREVIAWTTDRGVKLPSGCSTLSKAREAGVLVLEGPAVTIEMAVRDGWYDRKGSKWQTMPSVMLNYRAATFFGRLYAPELLMGLPTVDELEDTAPAPMSRPIFREIAAEPKAALAESSPAPDQTPEPKPTPAAAPASPEPKQSEPQPPGELGQPEPEKPKSEQQHYARAVSRLCAMANPKIPESVILGFCAEVGLSDGSAPSLAELPLNALKTVHDQWADTSKRIQAARKGGAQ